MRSRLPLSLLALSALSSCGVAQAKSADPNNPFHCGVAFSVYYGIAKAKSLNGEAMLRERMTREAIKARSLPASQRTRAEGEALMKRLLENSDEAYETVMACMKRQDAER